MADNKRTTIFVHGFLGWGEREGFYSALPYWGLTSGDLLEYLRSIGYDCHSASVGSLSSAWDRACELYAQISGGVVDYGAAHAEKFGHARYGVEYAPLIEDWENRSIDLVGHSFGGTTIRLFLGILANGMPEEVEAAKTLGTVPSPFFEGGKAGCIHSVSTISSPHNGTTLTDSSSNFTSVMMMLFTGVAKTLGISDLKNGYDFKLDQFGIRKKPGEPVTDTIARMLDTGFLQSGDHAIRDLSIDGTASLNEQLSIMPGIYYFSYPCCRSHMSLMNYHHKPDKGMTPLFTHCSISMGRWCDTHTPGGHFVGKEWLPNDGLVNTISAMYPTGEKFRIFNKNAVLEPGVWNVMPVRRLDHFAVIGGVFNADRDEIWRLYLNIMGNIDKTYQQ